jgi:hypothetical protein
MTKFIKVCVSNRKPFTTARTLLQLGQPTAELNTSVGRPFCGMYAPVRSISVSDMVKVFVTSTASVVVVTTPCVVPTFGVSDSEFFVDFSIEPSSV